MPYVDQKKRREYQKMWNTLYYKKNKAKEVARVAKRKHDLRKWLDAYRQTLACEKCGENHPACLDFHHKNSSSKELTIGNIKAMGWSRGRVLLEIKKCMVVCANCHRKMHFRAVK